MTTTTENPMNILTTYRVTTVHRSQGGTVIRHPQMVRGVTRGAAARHAIAGHRAAFGLPSSVFVTPDGIAVIDDVPVAPTA